MQYKNRLIFKQKNKYKAALSSMYTVDDNLMTVFCFSEGKATIYSFTEEPTVIEL